MSTPRLFILVGIPGCGKSTWASNFFPNARIVSSDAIREELSGDATDQTKNGQVFNVFHQRIGEGLAQGRDVVADSTALDKFARENLRSVAATFSADVHLVVFVNVGQAIIRNQQRDRIVPRDVMDRMVVKYERALNDIEDENLAQFYKSVIQIRSLS